MKKSDQRGERWPALRAELRAFADARRGRIGELAGFLGVARPQVSAWLAGTVEPGAEVALGMLAWLGESRAAESKARADAVASAPARLAAALSKAPLP